MNDRVFDINNFNIIQDEENYYFFRALNITDNSNIEQNITTENIERIRKDRERFNSKTKYIEDSKISNVKRNEKIININTRKLSINIVIFYFLYYNDFANNKKWRKKICQY